MLDIEKYFIDEWKKTKKKSTPLVQVEVKPMSANELYDQQLINGGTGIDATMKYIMDTEAGLPTTPLQVFHNTTSSGMQVL